MYTVDRIEEDIVILEDRKTLKIIEIEINKLPKDIQEGSILDFIDNEFVLNTKKTKETKKRINDLFESLKK